MKNLRISKQQGLKLTTTLPGDKSISHRAVIMSSLAKGKSIIKNFLNAGDTLGTAAIFKSMGIGVKRINATTLQITGKGLKGLKAPKKVLDCGNSGTTMRLVSGVLAGQHFKAKLIGDVSLSKRPMKRIAIPLKLMGAHLKGRGTKITPPIVIEGRGSKPIHYTLPVASAQVKSAVLLAGLFANGVTRVTEPIATRDHTEIYFKRAGIRIQKKGKTWSLKGGQQPKPVSLEVPGDISSAAFMIAMGLLVPKSNIQLKNILFNPHRIGMIQVLKRMKANIKVKLSPNKVGERVAHLQIKPSSLKATQIPNKEIPSLIDELPILMVIATQAKGKTWIRGVEELRVKETDRVASMVNQLQKMGADIGVQGNDVWVKGPTPLKGASIQSYHDHRTAMSFAIAGMIASGETTIRNIDCIQTSFTSFFKLLKQSGVSFHL